MLRHRGHDTDGALVRVVVGALQPRIARAAVVAFRVLLGAPRGAGEEAASEGTERHQADPELTQDRKDIALEPALPQRVLALHRGDRVHGVRAADERLADFREPEKPHLSLADQVGHRADDVLDRHVGIGAMLVEQVDMVGVEPLQRSIHDLADVLGAAVEADDLAVSIRKPNLVATSASWRRPFKRAAEQRLVGEGP